MEFVQIRKRHFSSIGEKTGYEESIVGTAQSCQSKCLQPEGTVHAYMHSPLVKLVYFSHSSTITSQLSSFSISSGQSVRF